MQGGLSSVPITPHPGFSAVSGLGCVSLSWVNAAEPNNCGFEIERRSMESKQWTAVSFVPATNSGKEYAYTDTRVSAGSYIYRMKQINRDGTFQYYGVQEVTVTIPTILSLRANSSAPSNVHAAVEYTVAKNENVTLKVYNVLGQEVATLVNGEQHPGVVYYVAVDTSKYVAGMYYYKLQTKDQTLMQRIFVAK
jgi:hypothetical protein